MIIKNTEIPWNMEYIFTDTDIELDEKNTEMLENSYSRATNLQKHNGAIIMGLVSAAVYWLRYAYTHKLPVNKLAYEKCIQDLNAVKIPAKYF